MGYERQIHRCLGPALEAADYTPMRADTGEEGLAPRQKLEPEPNLLRLITTEAGVGYRFLPAGG